MKKETWKQIIQIVTCSRSKEWGAVSVTAPHSI